MAKKRDLPGFIEKRKILFGAKTSPQKMREAGEQFMDAERYDDALEFFERCDARDLARTVADRAMSAGNVPLYMRAKRVMEEPIEDAEWARLADAAEQQGRPSMALVAHLKAGNESEAERLRRLLPSQSPPGEGQEDEAAPAADVAEESVAEGD
jgi:hypothetical protein